MLTLLRPSMSSKILVGRNRAFVKTIRLNQNQTVVLVNHSRPLSIAPQYNLGKMDFFKIQAERRALVESHGNVGMTFPP